MQDAKDKPRETRPRAGVAARAAGGTAGSRSGARGAGEQIRGGGPAERVSVVVPVYREAVNIRPFAEALDAALSPAGIGWELLFVDDDSRDGSEAAVADLSGRLPVRIDTRREARRDLSLSVLRGIRGARFDRVVVMDADLSHPPERIPHLLAALEDVGIAIGSRYAAGGSVDHGWSLARRLNSRIATLLAYPLARCGDPMSGFFAVDRRTLPDLGALRPLGYKIALELMVRGRLAVREVPIAFRDRRRGSSKMTWRQQRDYLVHLGRLYRFRFPGPARFACFALVGASGFVIDVACWQGLQAAGLGHRWARFLSFWPAVTWNWCVNRRVTFADRPREMALRQWTLFVASSLLGVAVNVGTYLALTAGVAFFDRHRLLALVSGVAVGAAANFALANRFVYRTG